MLTVLPSGVNDGFMFFMAIIGTFLLLSYPALKPYLATYCPTLVNQDFEHTVYPILFFLCMEFICAAATPPLALVTSCFLAISYAGYIYAFRLIGGGPKSPCNYMPVNEFPSDYDADETDDDEEIQQPSSLSHSGGSDADDEIENSGATDDEEEDDNTVVFKDEEVDEDESEKSAEEMVEVADNNDVFTILTLSEIQTPAE